MRRRKTKWIWDQRRRRRRSEHSSSKLYSWCFYSSGFVYLPLGRMPNCWRRTSGRPDDRPEPWRDCRSAPRRSELTTMTKRRRCYWRIDWLELRSLTATTTTTTCPWRQWDLLKNEEYPIKKWDQRIACSGRLPRFPSNNCLDNWFRFVMSYTSSYSSFLQSLGGAVWEQEEEEEGRRKSKVLRIKKKKRPSDSLFLISSNEQTTAAKTMTTTLTEQKSWKSLWQFIQKHIAHTRRRHHHHHHQSGRLLMIAFHLKKKKEQITLLLPIHRHHHHIRPPLSSLSQYLLFFHWLNSHISLNPRIYGPMHKISLHSTPRMMMIKGKLTYWTE